MNVHENQPLARLRSLFWTAAALTLLLSVPPLARAQFAVIDVASIQQLIQEAKLLDQLLKTSHSSLDLARTEYASMTGDRGMQLLLSGVNRNYLPKNWAQLQAAMQGAGGTYGALSGGVAATVAADAVVPPAVLAQLPDPVRKQVRTGRQLAALHQNLTREALETTSERFENLQQLINAIPNAADQKAVLDLQARIDSEATQLQNEQSKLVTLYQLVEAEERANERQLNEQAVVGLGQFATRFQPTP